MDPARQTDRFIGIFETKCVAMVRAVKMHAGQLPWVGNRAQRAWIRVSCQAKPPLDDIISK